MFVSIRGADLFIRTSGQGEPILCLHGFPLSGELWAPLTDRLAGRYSLVVPDLRGMGRSKGSSPCSMADYADDAAILLDALDEERPVVVVSLSMGGYVAFEFVRRYADRVRALVLADTRADADSEEARRTREQTAVRAISEGSRAIADDMIGKLFAPQAPKYLVQQWHQIMVDTDPEGMAAALLAMRDRPDSFPTLVDFPHPALVIVGEHDSITPPAMAERMHKVLANSRLSVIPGAGHMTPVESPDSFHSIVNEFLETLPPI